MDELDQLAEQIAHREEEIAAYTKNVTMFSALAASLPDKWPAHLERVKGVHPHKAAAEVPFEEVPLLADLQQGDEARARMASELLERTKAERIYNALVAQMPEAERESRVAAARERIAAQRAQAEPPTR